MQVAPLGRALAHRNYRLFLLGQGISLIGTWMQQVAMSWLLYRLTGSAFLLGLISFSSQIPSLVLSPLAGVAADRWNRHRALIVTQSLAMVQAMLLLVVVHSGENIVWPLIGVGFFLGVVNAFDMPLRQSFLVEMVPNREHLGNAIALNSSIVNGARLVGPSLAGLVIARWGESTCFLLNAASYVAVVVALLAMRDLPVRAPRPRGKVFEHLKEGVLYAFGFAPLRTMLLMLAVISFRRCRQGDVLPDITARMNSSRATAPIRRPDGAPMGAGAALVSALYLASRQSVLGLGRVLVIAAAVFGARAILSLSSTLWVSLAILTVTGFSMMLHMAASNTLIQTIVEEDKRGRVLSLYSIAFLGVAPLGSFLGGTLGDRIGAPLPCHLWRVCIVAALAFASQLPRCRARPPHL